MNWIMEMSDELEILEMMREVARTRIDLLKRGVTFHNGQSRDFYLREYEEKLRRIEELIRRRNIRLVRINREDPGRDDGGPAV
jgi:hypothetical protein